MEIQAKKLGKMGLFIVIESINLVTCTWHIVVLRWGGYIHVGW